ncbi:helix-turn-helix transcriptional regulator [Amycolatopsis sp. NPDC051071]|uniref:helix-turn-helix domain-containing protein n=1 Tax=Amycolatopsis sp. NPDC051071 TaxID=3154637 RepID=UPI0034345723
MPNELLDVLGYDADDPKVMAGRKHGVFIARLIETLVHLRDKLKLTQKDVAGKMDTTQSSVSNFERAGGDPKISTVLRYAEAIGAEVRVSIVIPGERSSPGHVTARPAQAFVPRHYIAPPFEVAVR